MSQTPNPERQIWMYTQMLRIRTFEESVKRAFTEHPGVIRGHTHLADGAEASIVGCSSFTKAMAHLRRHGYRCSRQRSKAMMARFRRETVFAKGGGSMHLTDEVDSWHSGIVGAGIPHAAGVAWALQIRKRAMSLVLRRWRRQGGVS